MALNKAFLKHSSEIGAGDLVRVNNTGEILKVDITGIFYIYTYGSDTGLPIDEVTKVKRVRLGDKLRVTMNLGVCKAGDIVTVAHHQMREGVYASNDVGVLQNVSCMVGGCTYWLPVGGLEFFIEEEKSFKVGDICVVTGNVDSDTYPCLNGFEIGEKIKIIGTLSITGVRLCESVEKCVTGLVSEKHLKRYVEKKAHKYKVGDKVKVMLKTGLQHHFDIGEIVTIIHVDDDGRLLCINGWLNQTLDPQQVEPYVWKPTRDELKILVAEMIVRRLDETQDCNISAYQRIGITAIYDDIGNNVLGEALMSDNDTWDTLTGLYVALMKADGEPLPKRVTS